MKEKERKDLFGSDIANKYESQMQRSLPGRNDLYEIIAAYFHETLSEVGRILVVGAGGGKEILHFKRFNPKWEITGIDPSLDMIETARESLRSNNISAELHHCYLEDLPAGDPFDAATSILVSHFIRTYEEKLESLWEISARLKSGGPFVMVSLYGNNNDAEYKFIQKVWHRYMLAKGIEHDDLEEHKNKREEHIFPVSDGTHRELLAEAGFTDIIEFFSAFHFKGWFAKKK
ncbi:MAG: class I SAM-dependent methyltransferase [Nitrospinota bacterium]|nr:class I SAM-dependent methyltransferase [Nitrospinota bacterium]